MYNVSLYTRAGLADGVLTYEEKFKKGVARSEWALMEVLAANLRRLREGRKWNQSDLSVRACVDPSQVSRAENPEKGGRSVQLDTLVKFAHALNVAVWVLLLPPPALKHPHDESATTIAK